MSITFVLFKIDTAITPCKLVNFFNVNVAKTPLTLKRKVSISFLTNIFVEPPWTTNEKIFIKLWRKCFEMVWEPNSSAIAITPWWCVSWGRQREVYELLPLGKLLNDDCYFQEICFLWWRIRSDKADLVIRSLPKHVATDYFLFK